MEPLLLICGDCGVRIRTTDPLKAKARACPRCESSLGPAVDLALEVEPVGEPEGDDQEVAPPRRWLVRRDAGLAGVMVTVVILAGLAIRGTSPAPSQAINRAVPPIVASRPDPEPILPPAGTPLVHDRVDEDDANLATTSMAELTPPPPLPRQDLAILEPHHRESTSFARSSFVNRSTSISLDPPPPPSPVAVANPVGANGPDPQGNREPRRLLVRGKNGRAMVARELGIIKDRLAVILPDGQIGLPDGQVLTEEPFVPATIEELRKALADDPEFAAFRMLKTAHYLVLYQGKTDTFARASGDLLEKLFDGLTAALRKNGLPVQVPEFPLVAVIFETEADFRANRRVAPDIQAYYEILSNRIYFYEKSRRDQESPEVSALRKPQTVAHEGTHQILHNVGIQPRMSDWPLWLVEGLAEYCSPPKITKKGGVDWAGLGQVNPLHMATIRDLDEPAANHFPGSGRQPIAPRDRRTPLVEYLVTQKELTPTDYALAWALTHYLATRRLDDFVAYIKLMSQLKPGQEQSPRDQLNTFRQVFGKDLAQMDGKIAGHLKKIKQPDVLPFYAVIFEQEVGLVVRRQAMVSQSPSVIRQWLESVTLPQGSQPHWEFLAQPNRNKAIEVVEQWIRQGN